MSKAIFRIVKHKPPCTWTYTIEKKLFGFFWVRIKFSDYEDRIREQFAECIKDFTNPTPKRVVIEEWP